MWWANGIRHNVGDIGAAVENSQRLEYAKTEAEASEMHATNARKEFYEGFHVLYQQAEELQQVLLDYHDAVNCITMPNFGEGVGSGRNSMMDYLVQNEVLL